eukprot:1266309-Pleurochrysis_carterae.AAC.4
MGSVGCHCDGVIAIRALAKESIERLLCGRQSSEPLSKAGLVERLATAVASALGHGVVKVVAVADGALDGVVVGALGVGVLRRRQLQVEQHLQVGVKPLSYVPAVQIGIERVLERRKWPFGAEKVELRHGRRRGDVHADLQRAVVANGDAAIDAVAAGRLGLQYLFTESDAAPGDGKMAWLLKPLQ